MYSKPSWVFSAMEDCGWQIAAVDGVITEEWESKCEKGRLETRLVLLAFRNRKRHGLEGQDVIGHALIA